MSAALQLATAPPGLADTDIAIARALHGTLSAECQQPCHLSVNQPRYNAKAFSIIDTVERQVNTLIAIPQTLG